MRRDRRDGIDRRQRSLIEESLERHDERRSNERRDSPRLYLRMWVADPLEGGVPQVFDGEVGLGGASWATRYPPLGKNVEVRFRIPELEDEFFAPAAVVRTTDDGDDTRVHVVFRELPVRQELALAHWLQGNEGIGQ